MARHGSTDWLAETLRRAAGAEPPWRVRATSARLGRMITDWWPRPTWQADGIDVEAEMNATVGPFVEVGGPSPARSHPGALAGRNLYDAGRLSKTISVSNVTRPRPMAFPVGRAPFTRIVMPPPAAVHVDFLADARRLPFVDGGLGGLFCTGLYPASIFHDFVPEARRALEPGGFLVAQQVGPDGVAAALGKGFEPVRARQTWVHGGRHPNIDVIFRRPRER